MRAFPVGLALEFREELDTPSYALSYDAEVFVLLGVRASTLAGYSPRAFGEVGYFAKGFFMRGALGVLAWLGCHGQLVYM
jgi:hypothetical protein